MSEAVYSIQDVMNLVGCSDSWIRKARRKGVFGEVEKVYDKQGYSYRFTPEQVDIAQTLYRGKGAPAGGSEPSPTRNELQAILVRSASEVEKWRGIAESHEQAIARLEAERNAERERLEVAQKRIEDLKAMSVLDRLMGKHKGL